MIPNRKTITTIVVSFFVVSFLFLALPQEGNAGFGPPPGAVECCQLDGGCFDIMQPGPPGPGPSPPIRRCLSEDVVSGAICSEAAGICEPLRNVPTISEWGLIAMAGVLGIIGFMVIRRRRATA